MIVVIKKPGEPAGCFKVDGRRRSHVLEDLIGGTPTQCFRLHSKPGVLLLGWCDDDNYSKGLQLNFARPTDGHEILGTVVITSLGDTKNGPDWVGLNDAEQREAIDLMAALSAEPSHG